MKQTLLIFTALMLVVGFSKEPINGNELVEKDGVMYTKGTNIPYSGDVFGLYKNGQKEYEGTYKDGELDLYTEYFESWEELLKWAGSDDDDNSTGEPDSQNETDSKE